MGGLLGDLFGGGSQLPPFGLSQQQQALGLGLFGGLGLGRSVAQVPASIDIRKPWEEKPLTFLQILRNEIDEWLKL